MPPSKIIVRAPHDRERLVAGKMTGRYLMTMKPGTYTDVSRKLETAGFVAAIPLSKGAKIAKPLPRGHYLIFENVSTAVVDPNPEQEDVLHALAANEPAILSLQPERILSATVKSDDYVRGWRDSASAFAASLLDERRFAASFLDESGSLPVVSEQMAASLAATWGLIATNAANSELSGANIKLAVLDTGFDLSHRDFAQRQITTQTFVGDGLPFQDPMGHGTHCVGIAAGPKIPLNGPRYGVAHQASIYVGRVLDNTGHAGDANVVAGISWALEENCDIVLMAFETYYSSGDQPYSWELEYLAEQTLARGCLLVAAAGNEASQSKYIGAVGTPASAPSILAVAAVDRNFDTADFSNRVRPRAPGVKGPDLAAPGVDIYSAWPTKDGGYRTFPGTSAAASYVAGITALFAHANPGVRGQKLMDLVLGACATLPGGPARKGEIGVGFVQAPSAAIASLVAAPARPRRRRVNAESKNG